MPSSEVPTADTPAPDDALDIDGTDPADVEPGTDDPDHDGAYPTDLGRDDLRRDEARRDEARWDRELLVARYGEHRAAEILALATGRPAPHKRASTLAVVLAVVAAVALTWVFWAWRTSTTGTFASQLVGFQQGPAQQSLIVTWSVSRDPGTVVSCEIVATDPAGNVVGQPAPITVRAATDRTTEIVTDVRTIRPAANASIQGCQLVRSAGAAG